MSQGFQRRLDAVDGSLLTPLVRQALHQPMAELSNWEQRPLGGGAANPAEGVLARILFSGQARVQNEIVPWSLVLKAFAPPPEHANDDPSAWSYWKREVLSYQSGLLADLGGGLTAPTCFAVVEYEDEEHWVWMEYINEENKQWPLARYQLTARHLGHFNGASLERRPLPVYSWFNVQNLRQRAERGTPLLQKGQHSPYHPSWLSAESMARRQHLYQALPSLLQALAQLPSCFCHADASRRNLLARQRAQGEEETVAIDWSAIGLGAVGEETGLLTASSLFFLDVAAEDALELDALVFAGYLSGLREAGWRGEEALVRLGYCAAAALFMTFAFVGPRLRHGDADDRWSFIEDFFGRPRASIQATWSRVHDFGLDLGDEALALLGRVGA